MSHVNLYGIKVTLADARRFLPPDKYEQYEVYSECEKRNCLLPWGAQDYRRLIAELRRRKHQETVKTKFNEYQKEIISDKKAISCNVNNQIIKTSSQALKFILNHYPTYQNLDGIENPLNWIPKYNKQITITAKKNLQKFIEQGILEKVKHRKAFKHWETIWPLVSPQCDYLRTTYSSLVFRFNPLAICSLTIHYAEHEKTIDGYVRTYPGSDKTISYHTEILDNRVLGLPVPKIEIPIKLIRSLASGKIQTDRCRVTKKTSQAIVYEIKGRGEALVLSDSFLRFLMGLGANPLKKLLDLGLIDDISMKICETLDNSISVDFPVREKDRRYMKLVHQTDGYLTYQGWGKVLGLSREGAYRMLMRLGNAGFVSIRKHQSNAGCIVGLTEKGTLALR
jgi:hypothetical protein